MRTFWMVCWRGLEEEWPSPQDAFDRWERLGDLGIVARVFEVVAGRRVEVCW